MLGWKRPTKNSLWPWVILAGVTWMALVWGFLQPTPNAQAQMVARDILENLVRTYDYADRIEGQLPQARRVRDTAQEDLLWVWKQCERAGLANDALWLDWSVICLRLSEDLDDDETTPWHDRAVEALIEVSSDGRESSYYHQIRSAAMDVPLTEDERSELEEDMEDLPGSWALNFLAWKLSVQEDMADAGINAWGRIAYLKAWAYEWWTWGLRGVALVLAIPAWLCLRRAAVRRKRAERLQDLWPLSLALEVVSAWHLPLVALMAYSTRFLQESPAFYEACAEFGWETVGVALILLMMLLYVVVLYGMKLSLAKGWGGFAQVFGIQWRDFFRLRHLCVALFSICLIVSVVGAPIEMLDFAGWGNALLDITSRWPFAPSKPVEAAVLVFMVIVGPVWEELVYRGFLFGAFRTRLGNAGAIWLSSLLFAAVHAYSFGGTVWVLVMGLLLGWLRARTGALAVPIMVHMGVNALFVVDMSFLVLW